MLNRLKNFKFGLIMISKNLDKKHAMTGGPQRPDLHDLDDAAL